MTKIENDLDKSKSLREKQAKEFNKQIENLKSDHKKEVSIMQNSKKNDDNKKHKRFKISGLVVT